MSALAEDQNATPAGGESPVSGPAAGAPAAGAATPNEAAAPPAKGEQDAGRKAPLSRAEAASARAQARTAASAKNTALAGAADGQTAGDGASTQPAADAGAADPDTSKAGAAAPPDSTLQAPQDWPREWTERYAALPTDEARQMVLAMNKDMTAGLQKGLQTLAEQRRGSESLFDAMKRTGHEAGEVEALLDLSTRFKDDPRGVLEALAEQAGVELASLAAEAPPPEFADAAALAKWASDKARRDVERQLRAERQREDAERQKADVQQRFQRELADAGQKFGDLKQHWPAVVETLTAHPLLSVEQAYKLARFDEVAKTVATVDALRAEVASLKAAEEARRKAATQPAGRGGNGRAAPPPAGQSRAESAMARAERRLAANGAA